MTFLDYLKPVSSWSTSRLRDYLQDHHPENLTLLDVRQAAEYEAGHLPGAVFIPLAELPERLDELDPGRPIVVYCASGLRSRGATALLAHSGFAEVHNLTGGLNAWHGPLAEGLPQSDLDRFRQYDEPEQQVALAWYLEEGTRCFYRDVAGMVRDAGAAALFRDLERAEEHHMATLRAVYEGLAGKAAAADFPHNLIAEMPEGGYMEGGFTLVEAFDWVRGRPVTAILELAMTVETSALDRYLFLQRNLPNEHARRVFEILADEERRHLKRLGAILEHFV
jgi:rhodanese-related sulfurtransferase/rubrerythrin